MCCGKTFWKRGFVFCLTFVLGIFVVGSFNLIKPSQSEITICPLNERKLTPDNKPAAIPAPADDKTCVPMDKNLKYEKLAAEEKNVTRTVSEDSNLKATKREEKKKSAKAEKQNNSADPRPYNPSEDSAELTNLLHKERCFETPVQ